jgi:hypothetical protein
LNASSTYRDIRLDALRGLFLFIIAAVHVPSPLSSVLHEPFGFISAAEGFIFLSAALAGRVYGRVLDQDGRAAMTRKIWSRARLVYIVHVAVMLPVALIVWLVARDVTPLANHFHDFLTHPLSSLALIPLLLHQAPLFDILPMYVVFLLATPLVLAAARRWGWGVILSVSALGWFSAQFEALRLPADALLPVRGGSFNVAAWQMLWFAGVALGEQTRRGPVIPARLHKVVLVLAGALVLAGLGGRHGLIPLTGSLADLFTWVDKWTLGPLRLLNFAAWVVLLLAWNPQPPVWLMRQAAVWGRHSLAVFALHLPLVICASSVIMMFPMTTLEKLALGLSVPAAISIWVIWLETNSQRRRQPASAFQPPQSWLARRLQREIVRS